MRGHRLSWHSSERWLGEGPSPQPDGTATHHVSGGLLYRGRTIVDAYGGLALSSLAEYGDVGQFGPNDCDLNAGARNALVVALAFGAQFVLTLHRFSGEFENHGCFFCVHFTFLCASKSRVVLAVAGGENAATHGITDGVAWFETEEVLPYLAAANMAGALSKASNALQAGDSGHAINALSGVGA